MKVNKREKQFKIRVCDDFVKILDILVDQDGGSQADMIYKCLSHYALTHIREFQKNEPLIRSIEDLDTLKRRKEKHKNYPEAYPEPQKGAS